MYLLGKVKFFSIGSPDSLKWIFILDVYECNEVPGIFAQEAINTKQYPLRNYH